MKIRIDIDCRIRVKRTINLNYSLLHCGDIYHYVVKQSHLAFVTAAALFPAAVVTTGAGEGRVAAEEDERDHADAPPLSGVSLFY